MEPTPPSIDTLLGLPRGQLRRLRKNLVLTGVSIVIMAIAGYLLSFPVNLFLNNEATNFKLGATRTIETSKLITYESTQRATVLFFAGVGAISAQVVFAFGFRKNEDQSEQGDAPNSRPAL